MISSPNKNFFPELALGSRLDFFTIESSVDITSDTPQAQALLNTLVETISLNGQPVISALVTNAAPVAAQFGALGTPYTGATYSLKFAVEHTGAWTQDTLATALSAITFDSYTVMSNSDGTTPLATDDVTTTTSVVDAVPGVTATVAPFTGVTVGSMAAVVAVGSDVTTSLPAGLNMVVTYNSL
jgi:hypothetical protein